MSGEANLSPYPALVISSHQAYSFRPGAMANIDDLGYEGKLNLRIAGDKPCPIFPETIDRLQLRLQFLPVNFFFVDPEGRAYSGAPVFQLDDNGLLWFQDRVGRAWLRNLSLLAHAVV